MRTWYGGRTHKMIVDRSGQYSGYAPPLDDMLLTAGTWRHSWAMSLGKGDRCVSHGLTLLYKMSSKPTLRTQMPIGESLRGHVGQTPSKEARFWTWDGKELNFDSSSNEPGHIPTFTFVHGHTRQTCCLAGHVGTHP